MLKDKLETMSKSSRELEDKVILLENKLKACDEEKSTLEAKLDNVVIMHDDLEQYTRIFNLEVYGVPEEPEENPEEAILNLARCTEIDLTPEDIDICHRFKLRKVTQCQSRLLFGQFTNYYSRERMYKNRAKLQRTNVGSFLRGVHKVYINENLTARRSGFFKKERDKKRHHDEWKIWTLDAKFFSKRTQ